jgi:NADH-quinone oxidoreductase subunit N
MAAYIGITADGTRTAFGGMFVDDAFARFAKIAILLSAAAILVIGRDYMQKADILRFEYPVLVTLAVIGMMMMVSAGDLIALYMGLELQSLALYVIAALRRDSARSTEAGLKYFILGALSSGLLLYGASLTYGYAGTTLFSGIASTVATQYCVRSGTIRSSPVTSATTDGPRRATMRSYTSRASRRSGRPITPVRWASIRSIA